jgi:hypothetical protein
MSPLELLAPETPETVPFSTRLAQKRLASRTSARSDRRQHLRRSAEDLEWLRSVRLTGGTGYDVKLVDLSEGGALLEVDAPLRPGVALTLELSGPGIETAIPIEVLRCYIANLRGELATYRGACAFPHLIDIPNRPIRRAQAASAIADFVGTEAALTYLLDRCPASSPRGGERFAATTVVSGFGRTPDDKAPALDRIDVLRILYALRVRTSGAGSDVLSRHTSELLAAMLSGLVAGTSRDAVVSALEDRHRGLPKSSQSMLQPTLGRLILLVDYCARTAAEESRRLVVEEPQSSEAVVPTAREPEGARPDVLTLEAAGQAKTAFQKIVARHADGKIIKGYTQDFHPSRPQFSLWPTINATPKERVVVSVARLKAVFFVRDFNGNPGHKEQKTSSARGQGRRLEVTFADGEVITGATLNYRPDGQGFFMSPSDAAANNTRVFVVATALRRVRFL